MWVLVLALMLGAANEGAAEATPTAAKTGAKPRRFDPDARQARLLTRLMKRGDPAAIDYVLRTVEGGAPPQSLAAFLQAARSHPQDEYARLLRPLTHYRKDVVRAQALAALAAIDHTHGAEAALLAMEDTSLEIRLLGLDLAHSHTAPHVEEAMLRLVARDEAVAKVVRAARR